jgi:hypothetical protein
VGKGRQASRCGDGHGVGALALAMGTAMNAGLVEAVGGDRDITQKKEVASMLRCVQSV